MGKFVDIVLMNVYFGFKKWMKKRKCRFTGGLCIYRCMMDMVMSVHGFSVFDFDCMFMCVRIQSEIRNKYSALSALSLGYILMSQVCLY